MGQYYDSSSRHSPYFRNILRGKKTLWVRFKNEMVHYWHGTKLLGTEIKISSKLARRISHGEKLTRREQQQLRRTTGDLFRLIPFSVFIVVPFMEFLLPVALKLFPNMLPSTFEDSFAADEKKRTLLKMRLQVAKFLQQMIEESWIATSKTHTEQIESVNEFSAFFKKIRTTGEQASTKELIRVAKLFPNELTLDNLTRPQLLSMCRYMNLNAFGTDAFLRYQIRTQMNSIKEDDKLIMAEGVKSLTPQELFNACQARGMCTLNVTPERMKSELVQWLELHLTHSIPSTLLILSRAFSSQYPTSTSSTTTTITTTTTLSTPSPSPTLATEAFIPPIAAEALQATLSSLPETLVSQTKIRVSELEGSPATAKQKLDVLKEQEDLIAKEKLQEDALKAVLRDSARLDLSRESIAHDLNALLDAKTEGGEVGVDATLPLPPLSHLPARKGSQLMTDAQATAHAPGAPPHAAVVPLGVTHLTHPLDNLVVSAVEDKAHLSKEQLLELREALGIMSSRSANLSKQKHFSTSSSARRRLGPRLDAMITRLDMELLEYSTTLAPTFQHLVATERGVLSTVDIASALRVIKHAPEDAAIAQIVQRLDVDGDGLVLLSQIWDVADRVAHEEGTGILLEGGRHVRYLLGDLLTSEKTDRRKDGVLW
ncbi:hypothetical protein BG006_006001 [Podila minutissima]|uniref:Letm1 RBD domain-containing protein n=1 Tax=Podila minutissima TaxID=64525 RepID=A0A9P5SK27_9FUNG|nr:hypothetical protein BG006_006001 [Podila minutissima]